jgi:hypothetical protein
MHTYAEKEYIVRGRIVPPMDMFFVGISYMN